MAGLSLLAFRLPNPLFDDGFATVVESSEGHLLGAMIAPDGQWRFPPEDSIPQKFRECLLAFEDNHFYHHPGINPISMMRALKNNLRAGKVVQGGSTLTMQVIRLSRKGKPRTLWEKMHEMVLALKLELKCSKTEILNTLAEKEKGVLVNGKYFNTSSKGIDEVEFFISTNPGEDVKPLAKVASGGEVSRIMLALKSTLAKNDKLPLLIFDEIDVGVSGRVAQKVGLALKNLSSFHQVISITHLPQIASLADHHFSIEKIAQNERVISSIKKLPASERITEIAKLLSGEIVTEASLKSARELIGPKE